MGDKKRIVILGAGYGGVHAAKLLNRKFKKNSEVQITLIDKNTYHTLLTDLHEVAGARVEPDTVQVDLNRIFSASKVKLVTDVITNIDFENKRLLSETESYNYDYLIFGTGSQPAFFGVPGCKENAFTIWSFEDALKIKEHIESMFKKARLEKNVQKRREMLTFIVAGAGFTGIEVIGELLEWKKKLCRENYIDEKEVRLMVVEALGNILTMIGDKMKVKAEKYLRKHNVEVMKNAPIVKVNGSSITLKDGREINTHTLIWTCGVQGNECAEKFGLTMGKRCRIQANEYMQTIEYENVYVVGDNAYFEEQAEKEIKQGKEVKKLNEVMPIPQIVETAIQTADTAVYNIAADMEKKEKKAFKSNYHGFMVSIGGRYGVAEVVGMQISGFFAMAVKHLVNMHYLFGVGGVNLVWEYLMHEFFNMKERRSFLGGHLGAKSPSFWIAILRVYVGVMWLVEGINKVKEGWLNPANIFIVTTSDVAGASQQAANTITPILATPPGIYQWFMNHFIAPFAFVFQAGVVLVEIAIGLALIAGLFTFLASLVSIFLTFNFILSSMAGVDILWYTFAGIALLGGGGRAFGLDYYVMPWIKKWWGKTRFARKTYLFIDKPNITI